MTSTTATRLLHNSVRGGSRNISASQMRNVARVIKYGDQDKCLRQTSRDEITPLFMSPVMSLLSIMVLSARTNSIVQGIESRHTSIAHWNLVTNKYISTIAFICLIPNKHTLIQVKSENHCRQRSRRAFTLSATSSN